MYEEIDMDNLTTLLAQVITVPTPSHPPLSNGTSSLNSNTASSHADVCLSTMNSNSLANHP